MAVAHDELRDRRELGVLHRPAQEHVDALAAALRAEHVGVAEEHGIDLLVRDEVLDLDRPAALRLRGLEVLRLHVDELALLVLEGTRDLLVGDRLRLGLADLLVADPAAVLPVDEVEVQRVLGDRRVHAHGRVHQAEADAPAPYSSWSR